MLRCTIVFIGLLIGAAAARADITRFDLSGVVTDATGGVLPGVIVTLKNADTGFNRSTVTDADGRYSFNAVPPTGKWTPVGGAAGIRAAASRGASSSRPTRNLKSTFS